ncbi:hypothetical protein ACGFYQ_10315 [Streptomyces sp. NPDC048258]|uniref:hypothetical protein n=1 Tax=Streptomyces sp. NPDC048258 TaxID=3365527 RepID=UPI00371013BA
MSATNAPQRLGFGLLGALLAGGLLLAACAAPDGGARAEDPGDAVFREDAPGGDGRAVRGPEGHGAREDRPDSP